MSSVNPRTRESVDAAWRFTLGDPPNVGESLAYERVKAWILPTGGELLEGAPALRRPEHPWTEGARALQGAGAIPAMRVAYANRDFDDSGWRQLDLPHDWGIEGPFRQDLPGNTGKRPCFGPCWYRKRFTLPAEDAGRRIWIEFDGAMSHTLVWCNGRLAGGWPYGYTSWRLDLTDFLEPGAENVLAVRLDNAVQSSRWYPGSGLYRHVWLHKTGPLAVAPLGLVVTTPRVAQDAALVNVAVTLDNTSRESAEVEVAVRIFATGPDGDGPETAAAGPQRVRLEPQRQTYCAHTLAVTRPRLWSLDEPSLYQVEVRVTRDGKLVDRVTTLFGIRAIEHTRDRGLLLNGERVPIRGVCLHHDLGALGAAVNTRAMERQLEILREMGCNAIRTSHNPPAPEFLDLCDRMGFLVQVEAFDCWRLGKRRDDYSRVFDEWHAKDLRAMVRRDRNHPCVFQWSIGNEILEQREVDGWKLAARLAGIVRGEDATRPVVAGLQFAESGYNGFQAALDVVGFNYKPDEYARLRARHPHVVMLGAETASTVSSRGEYFFPVSTALDGGRSDFQVSSYDYHAPAWASATEAEWRGLDDNPCVLGEFVWTGFDYLGEPTPYNNDATNLLNFADPARGAAAAAELAELGKLSVPSRSSYFGILDLAGFPKDRYFLYQSRWRPDLPVAHILPHWNWPERVGQITPVHVYTSGDEAELFLNGRSLGRRARGPRDYRLAWDDVVYEPGELRVVVWRAGQPWAESVQRTTGPAGRILLAVDRREIRADGDDLAFVTVTIADRDGLPVPRSCNALAFSIEGPGAIAATDNGDATDHTSFQSAQRRAYNGLALVIIRSRRGSPGTIRLRAEAEGLQPASIEISTTN